MGANGRARLGVALGVVALGGLTLLPVWRGHAADPGGGRSMAPAMRTIEPGPPAVEGPALESLPSPAVYPPSSFPLTFDHGRHARRGIACERCHGGAARSVSSKDNLLPGEEACRGCHLIDRTQPEKAVAAGQPAARCDACHPGFQGVGPRAGALTSLAPLEPPRVFMPAPALKFNHKLHGDRGMSCGLCHAGVENVALATTAQLPKMGLCLGCHDGRQATSRCAACHPTLPDGRLRTAFPGGLLSPSGSLRGFDAHTPTFRTQHKAAAQDEKYCATCHKPSECIECHGAGVIRPPDFHPVDYATLHAVDARRNNPDCSSCHRNQTFCVGCHQRLGVAPDSEGGQASRQPNNPFGTGTAVKHFHPPGWVRDEAGVVLTAPTPGSHSFQARRNIRTCVSCHREESCLNCHSADPTRSMAVNPHPPGFAGSAACRALSSRNTRGCLKCHQPGATALSCD